MTAKTTKTKSSNERSGVTRAIPAKPVASSLRKASAQRTAEKKPARLEIGDELPDATLQDQNDEPFSLGSLRGAVSVVYFYPKDDTPGCTREACAFQENLSGLKRLGVRVVGISPDPVGRHAKFAEKYGLKFTLLVDQNREFADACGVLVPKTLYGKTSIGIERSTFLLDAHGRIRRLWRKVKVDGHVEEVVEAVRELRRG